MLIKIIGVGLCSVIIGSILKEYRSDFAFFVNICASLIIVIMIIDGLGDVVDQLGYISNVSGIKTDVVTPIIKVIGIGYITEFSANIAEDSGNKGIASKIIMGGKIAICVLALPIIKSLISTIISII